MSSKYSFYNIKKSALLDLYSKMPVSTVNDNANNVYGNSQEISLYIHNSNLIMQECCLQTGKFRLLRDNQDGTLAVLYECIRKGNLHYITLYTSSNAYSVITIGDSLHFVSYISSENFEKLIKITDIPSKVIGEITSKIFISRNAFPLLVNGDIIYNEEYEKFKKLYTRYSVATKYTPASNILNNLLNEINSYIATGNLNKDCILKDYIDLQNFQDLCYDSIAILAPFVNAPSSVDLRCLTEKLQTNLNNISNLLDMYLENELRNEDIR